ncbi:hypothetical protein DW322_18725 [Rhodococcus rhodnii]|uniref:Uncharacterized protein n=2 Tax=Rhodococcus rhodnii TaxID=38312 RepID=R7WK25_9NOCA|nr:hypothetical protein [Rhodococcus rhodnii]EOM75640.1 hypothetical protein Rrhod_3100 [Rhodococcus rhodnii LMG 5362]TXG91843.1 hypothetical protein DW322_18725 [Rhodococcus rhodnii]
MTVAVTSLVLSGVLLLASIALREREVPATGVVGRGRSAHLLTAAVAVCVVVAAAATLDRLISLAG